MTVVVEYECFVIVSADGKLYAIEADHNIEISEIVEVYRIPYDEASKHSVEELLEMCEDYDFSGEPIHENDYVFWKRIEGDVI